MPELYDNWDGVLAAIRASIDNDVAVETTAERWAPPTGLGPMPERLRGRATGLLAELEESAAALGVLQREAGRHLAAVRAVPPAHDTDRSLYLDVTG